MSTTTHFPAFRPTIPALVAEAAGRHGPKTFVVLGDRRVTYQEAEEQSGRLARSLLASGVGKGARVGLLGPNSAEWVIALLGIARSGAVAALMNTYNKAPELDRIVRHSDQAALLTAGRHLSNDYLDRLEEAAPALAGATHERLMLDTHPFLRSVWVWGAETRPWCGSMADLESRAGSVSAEMLAAAEEQIHPADPAVMVYSSGSTADPKAAVHTHGATVRHAHNLWQFRELDSSDVLYTPMPLFWVGGLSFTLVAAMHAGATLVFEEHFEAGATLELIEREQVTQVLGWPHMIKALADHPDLATRDLSSLRAGNAPALLADQAPTGPGALRANSLGMTETLGPHTFGRREPLSPDKAGSFGFGVPGIEHRIVDPVTGLDTVVGEVGELWVRGYSVMLGFHKHEREETFTADGWYRTGDSGRFDADGHFYFTGRMGDVIKTSGMNVTPREVEDVLEAMPEVAMALVVGVDHPDRGQDVVAAIALRPGCALDAEVARERTRDLLATYKVPRRIEVFADAADLPWLDSGKLDRRAVARLLAARRDDGTSGGR